MATAKITIETLVDNQQLQELNKDLADGTKKLKEMQAQYRNWAKEGTHTTDEMAKLNAKIAAQKALNSQNSKEIRNLANELANAGKQASSAKDALSNMISDKLGVNLGDLMGKFSSTTALMTGMAAAAATIGASLVSAGRDVSAFANQFISYTKNMGDATEMYTKFNEVARNMNSSYDEQQIYDMAKGFLNVGVSADEAADLITKCTDAAAYMGKGADMANMLSDAFKRLAVGGELTEKQYKAMAEAGIDLTDVQEQMRQGGTVALEALKQKLSEYEGGMQSTKTTAAELEADIIANGKEIIRMTALLVDDFFGFSDSLREFYQWIIEVTGEVISSIKSMIANLREAKAVASDHADVLANIGTIEEAIGDKSGEAAQQAAEEWQRTYNERMAALKAERKEIEAQKEIYKSVDQVRKPVQSIAGGGKTSSGGGSSSKSNSDALKAQHKLEQEIAKINQDIIRCKEQAYALGLKHTDIINKQEQIGKRGLELEQLKYQQDMDSYAEQIRRQEELSQAKVKAVEDEAKAVKEAIDNGTAPDGSQAKLDKLMEQKQLLQELGEQTIANIEAERDARSAEYNDESGLLNNDPGSGLSVDKLNGITQALEMIKAKWSEFARVIQADSPQLKLALNTVAMPFADMCQDIISGTKSAGEAMADFVKKLIVQALNLLAQWTTIFALVSAFQGPAVGARVATKMVLGVDSSGGGSVTSIGANSSGHWGFASGGMVYGPGTSTSDSIPAMLSNGEAVLNASAVSAIGGASAVNAINDGDVSVMGGAGQSVTFNISAVDASSFGDFLARGGGNVLAQYTRNLNRSFSTDGVW